MAGLKYTFHHMQSVNESKEKINSVYIGVGRFKYWAGGGDFSLAVN